MIRLYSAANLQEAALLIGLLRIAGVRARLLNASAQGGVGEIPFTQAYPEIWIDRARDLSAARQVIEEFNRTPVNGQARRCSACGEDNPPAFDWCWNCGAAFPAP